MYSKGSALKNNESVRVLSVFYNVMKRLRLKDASSPLFVKAWNLYESSFPAEERRNRIQQQAIMMIESYHFDIIMIKEDFIGILLWWELESIRYVEHFAIDTTQRNLGLGKTALEAFIDESEQQIILEVEKPGDSLKQRRIRFYQRLGFILNSYDYVQPPYQEDGNFVELMLMSYPKELSEADLQIFITKCHPIIHRPFFEKNLE